MSNICHKHMSLVKRDVDISTVLDGINFSLNFSLKGEKKKAVKEPYEGKDLSADEFY